MSQRHSAFDRKSFRILDHLVLIAVASLPLAAFLPSTGPRAMATRTAAALGLSGVMFALGYLLWWLPGFAVWGRRRWLEPFVLPVFMTLALIYVVIAFLSYHCDPDATAMVVAAQLAALVYVSVRS